MGIFSKRQTWDEFTKEEHEVWGILFKEQVKTLTGLVDDIFFTNLQKLGVDDKGIPKIEDLNDALKQSSGINLIFDNETIIGKNFFTLLSQRKFPSTMFIRDRNSLYYLTEPDIFHDVFGHCPFLYEPIVGDIIQLFGEIGLKCIKNKISTKYIGRLYWYTVEFGLIKNEKNEIKIFGGGLASSKTESVYSIESEKPSRLVFNPKQMMMRDYTYNEIQDAYFILNSLEELKNYLENCNIEYIQEIRSGVETTKLRIDEIKC